MSGDLMGFIEKKAPYEESQWRYVGEVHSFLGGPLGYTGELREIIIGSRYGKYTGPICGEEVFPDDLSDKTKLNMLYRHTKNPDLEEFDEYFDKPPMHKVTVKLSEFNSFNWSQTISEDALERMREDVREKNLTHYRFKKAMELYFNIVASNREVLELEELDMSIEEKKSLFLDGEINHEGENLSLEKKALRESIYECWFQLLDLINSRNETLLSPPEIRFVFYLEG